MPYIGTSPSNGVRRVHTYTATASQTTFTGASSEGVTLSYADTNYIDVFQNGVLLGSADYTSTSGTSVVLAQGASVDDLIVIVVYDVFSVADTVSKADGGTFDGSITLAGGVSGDLDVDSKTLFVDASENKVGVGGETSLLGTLHVRTSDASLTTVNANADDLIIENNGNCGISICSSTSGEGNLNFIDSGDTNVGRIQYSHANNTLSFRANDNVAITIDSTGAVTKPLQPAFSVHKNGNHQDNMAVGSDVDITFDTERFDVNSDYNTSNSTFTAPVTGKYFFNLCLRLAYVDNVSNYIIASIVTSNESYRFIVDPTDTMTGDPDYYEITLTAFADMDASDTAKVQYLQSGGAAQTDARGNAQYTFFTGHLVC